MIGQINRRTTLFTREQVRKLSILSMLITEDCQGSESSLAQLKSELKNADTYLLKLEDDSDFRTALESIRLRALSFRPPLPTGINRIG